MGQGYKIINDFLNVKKCVINVTTNWQDSCEINCNETHASDKVTAENLYPDSFVNEEYSFPDMLKEPVDASKTYGFIKMQALSDSTLLISSANANADFIYLSLRIPEYFNMDIRARELEIIVRNKFQGDFLIASESGSVTIDKMRGNNINIDSGTSIVKVRKLLEGNANIIGSEINAKMINGDFVNINSRSGIEVEAMYAKSARIACHKDGNISIGLLQGSIETLTAGRGSTTISNIDGSFNVNSQDGDVNLQINKLDLSLSSSATALRGNLTAKVNPEVAVNLVCESTCPQTSRSVLTISSDTYMPYFDTVHGDDFLTQCKDAKVAEWLSSLPASSGQRKVGRLIGKSSSQHRNPHSSTQRSSLSGKINLQGAEQQSLRTFQRRDVNGESSDGNGSDIQDNVHLSFKASGNVCVESLSWMEAIRRKYGFLDSETSQQ